MQTYTRFESAVYCEECRRDVTAEQPEDWPLDHFTCQACRDSLEDE